MKRAIARAFQGFAALIFMAPFLAASADQPVDRKLGLQPPATPVMERIHHIHDVILMTTITVITLFVLGLLLWIIVRYNKRANPTPATFHHNTLLEVLWTGIPILILVMIAIPSFQLLAYEHDLSDADMTIKATGQNWYWDYEYPDNGGFAFTANMLTRDQAAAQGKPFRLGTDNPIFVPVGKKVKMIITGGDRIHSWTVPSFGVKMDAVPGRLNESWFTVEREGVFYGQCSELCGAKHAFMPIEVHAVSQAEFDAWAAQMQELYGSNESDPVTLAENR